MASKEPQSDQLPLESSQPEASSESAKPKPRKRATQAKAATKKSPKKVRKPEPLNELVNSNRIIEVPTIELESDDASQLGVPSAEVVQTGAMPAVQANAGTESDVSSLQGVSASAQPSASGSAQSAEHVTNIDELFAEVAAEYEAAQAQQKADTELKSEMVSDIDEPPVELSDVLDEQPVVEDQGLFVNPETPLPEDAQEDNIVDFEPYGAPAEDAGEQDFAEGSEEAEGQDALSSAMDTVRAYAGKGIDAVNEGISAVRNLTEAKHAHAEAQDQLDELEQQAADLADQLAYRRDITDNFEAILASHNAEIEAANNAFSEAADRQKTFEDQLVQGNAYLDKLKAANIKETAPYREIADAAKSTLEDAEQAYHNARSNLRIAKSQHRDALNSQEAQTSNAQRAVDNAAARLAELQDAYAQMKRDPTTGNKELTDTNRNVAAALAQLETAKAKLAQLTKESSGVVANAQAQLDAQQELMDRAEAGLAEAQREERDKREQYEALRKNADADEKDISAQLNEIEHKMNQANKDQEAANKRIAAAQAAIAEMKDIQAHPEITEALAAQVSEADGAVDAQRLEVDRLAEEEESLTQTTQNVRTALFVAIGVLVVILILIIWLLFIR